MFASNLAKIFVGKIPTTMKQLMPQFMRDSSSSDGKFEQYRIAKDFGFNLFSFYELLENDIQTESDLFNEFWYRWGDASF